MYQELWANAEQKLEMPGTKRLTEKINGCGFVKGIATSFVGAFASCLVLSEILRAYHKGLKHRTTSIRLSNKRAQNSMKKVRNYYSRIFNLHARKKLQSFMPSLMRSSKQKNSLW